MICFLIAIPRYSEPREVMKLSMLVAIANPKRIIFKSILNDLSSCLRLNAANNFLIPITITMELAIMASALPSMENIHLPRNHPARNIKA